MLLNTIFSLSKSGKKPNRSWVRETKFGRWFLGTHTWYRYVLSAAVIDFKQMVGARLPVQARLLDAGCGQGMAFGLLQTHFKPVAIVGIDIDREQTSKATKYAASLSTPTKVISGNASGKVFDAESFDIIFCHQLLHHTGEQCEVLREFLRILKPGGLLLVGESCKSFIESAPVRLLFRHPKMAQKDAEGYVSLVRHAGFHIDASDIRTSRPWWSRRLLGLAQKFGIGIHDRPPTEVLIAAFKPLEDCGDNGKMESLLLDCAAS